jgi:hypothetical protein
MVFEVGASATSRAAYLPVLKTLEPAKYHDCVESILIRADCRAP